MSDTALKIPRLSGNQLKIIAAIFMAIDHSSMLFFPNVYLFRLLGRISYPLFAFMIAEGAKYTKNKLKHFLMIFVLAVICQIVYFFFDNGSLYMCILVTFSLSTLCLYALQYFKKQLFNTQAKAPAKILSGALFAFSIIATNLFCKCFEVDYGFFGCILPVFINLFDFHQIPAPDTWKKLDCLPVRLACLCVGLIVLSSYQTYSLQNIGMAEPWTYLQWFSLLALPFLCLYSGEKGKRNMKYFFYLFYPLHLVLLEGIFLAIHLL